jgi:nitrogen-specific signal transduction histidine kinase
MNHPNGIFVGILRVDTMGVVISVELPPTDEPLIEQGKNIAETFLHPEGISIALLDRARAAHRGVACQLQNHAWVQLFLSGSPSKEGHANVYVFFSEEQNTTAHTKFRWTLACVIAGFAHEVRSPLASIMSLAEWVAAQRNIEQASLQALYKIPKLVGRIDNLLESLLQYGKPTPPQQQWHQLGQLLQNVVDSFHLSMRPKGILRLPPIPSIPIYTDANHTTSILTNLLTNALQATSSADKITIEIHTPPALTPAGFVAVDVIDSGYGISQDIQEHIFEPFFTTKTRGTGLGLALSRDLARMNGGELLLLRSSPSGSAFRYLLRTHNRPESTNDDV